MHNDYKSRLRRVAVVSVVTLIITWGFVAYLMWLNDQQERQIDALKAELYANSSSSDDTVMWI